jgi:hypothetical protein
MVITVGRLQLCKSVRAPVLLFGPNNAKSMLPGASFFYCDLTAALLGISVGLNPWVNHDVQQVGGRRGTGAIPLPATWWVTVYLSPRLYHL